MDSTIIGSLQSFAVDLRGALSRFQLEAIQNLYDYALMNELGVLPHGGRLETHVDDGEFSSVYYNELRDAALCLLTSRGQASLVCDWLETRLQDVEAEYGDNPLEESIVLVRQYIDGEGSAGEMLTQFVKVRKWIAMQISRQPSSMGEKIKQAGAPVAIVAVLLAGVPDRAVRAMCEIGMDRRGDNDWVRRRILFYVREGVESVGRRVVEKDRLYVSVPRSVANQIRARAHEKGSPISDYAAKVLSRAAKPRKTQAEPTRRRNFCSPDNPSCSIKVEGGLCSIEAPLYVISSGGAIGIRKIPARYCAVDVFDLLTSHNPVTGFGHREGYPAEAQEREYRLPVEQAKVRSIAEHFAAELILNTAPGALDGLPVIAENRIVLGGNGRAMACQLVYAGEGNITPEQMREEVLSRASQFGMTKSALARIKHPMIVRVIQSENDARKLAEWSRTLNASMSLQLDPIRIAVSRARYADSAIFEELAKTIGDDETLADYLTTSRSEEFVQKLQSTNVIDARLAPQLINKGLLNMSGREVVSNLLVAYILPDADALNEIGPGAITTISRIAPLLVKTSQMKEFNLLDAFRKSLRDFISYKNAPVSNVDEFLRQGGLFGGKTAALSAGDPLAVLLLRILLEHKNAAAKFAKILKIYIAKAGETKQGGLFDIGPKITPIQALQEAKDAVDKPKVAAVSGLGYDWRNYR